MPLRWVKLANFAAVWEAEITAARLRSAGIQAQTRGNDIVGIVGPGFQGSTTRGVDLLVIDHELPAARRILEDMASQPDEEDEYE
jgi:hypothetical protein